MASQLKITRTSRDLDILSLLAMTPATAELVFMASGGWRKPFTHLKNVERRLRELSRAAWLSTAPQETAEQLGRFWYHITPKGFALLGDTQKTDRGFFNHVSPRLEEHTYELAQVISHLTVSARICSIAIQDFRKEGSVKLHVGREILEPDASLQLTSSENIFNYFIEVDRGTEPICSDDPKRESIQRKVRLYERVQTAAMQRWIAAGREGRSPRFRVLFIANSVKRLQNILAVAQQHISETHPRRQRHLCYGILRSDFLARNDALRFPLALTHNGDRQAIFNELYAYPFPASLAPATTTEKHAQIDCLVGQRA